MTEKEKQLLLKDICAREPYHPRIQVFNQGYEGFQDGEFDTNLWLHHIDVFRFDRIEILPYLRPMSSMTEEEHHRFEWITMSKIVPDGFGGTKQMYSLECIDWINAHHFDYRGLINKGLALEAPKDMYKSE